MRDLAGHIATPGFKLEPQLKQNVRSGIPRTAADLRGRRGHLPNQARDRKSALRQDWPGLATALDDLAACPDLVTLLSK